MERSEEPLDGSTQTSTESAPVQQPLAPQSPALGVSGTQPLLNGDGEGGNRSSPAEHSEDDKWREVTNAAEKTEVRTRACGRNHWRGVAC